MGCILYFAKKTFICNLNDADNKSLFKDYIAFQFSDIWIKPHFSNFASLINKHQKC